MSVEWIAMFALIVGGCASWLVRSVLAKSATTSLEVRLASASQELAERVHEIDSLREERQRLLNALRAESERRAAAETQAARLPALEATLAEREKSVAGLAARIAELETRLSEERKAASEKLALLDEAQCKLSDAFKALCAEALQSNNRSFLHLATTTLLRFHESAKSDLEARQNAVDGLVRPLRESLEKVDGKLGELERARVSAYSALQEQLKSLVDTHLPMLHAETAKLVRALRTPTVRGRWGEIQLKRVVEMAGMVDHCDFVEQASRTTDDGRLRPDLIVRLPGSKHIVVDAKAPVEAYLQAMEAPDDETRQAHLSDHARQVRNHMTALSRKVYWEQFNPTPEFVVLFLPGEAFFSAALQQDPGLIEFGVQERVMIATPTTLISLLRAVAYGWRQEALARNAQEVADLGKQLYERIAKLAEHWTSVGDRLGKAVEAYNSATATLETRVLVSARRFRDLKATSEEMEIRVIEPLDRSPRMLQAPELMSLASDGKA